MNVYQDRFDSQKFQVRKLDDGWYAVVFNDAEDGVLTEMGPHDTFANALDSAVYWIIDYKGTPPMPQFITLDK